MAIGKQIPIQETRSDGDSEGLPPLTPGRSIPLPLPHPSSRSVGPQSSLSPVSHSVPISIPRASTSLSERTSIRSPIYHQQRLSTSVETELILAVSSSPKSVEPRRSSAARRSTGAPITVSVTDSNPIQKKWYVWESLPQAQDSKSSRKKNRYRNSIFADHPFGNDLNSVHPLEEYPGYSLPRIPTVFSEVDHSVEELLSRHDSGLHLRDNDASHWIKPGPQHLSVFDRNVRFMLRKDAKPDMQTFVVKLETLLSRLLKPRLKVKNDGQDHDSEHRHHRKRNHASYEVLDNGIIPMGESVEDDESFLDSISFHCSNAFLRLIIHCICKYYLLHSESSEECDDNGAKVVRISNPHRKSMSRYCNPPHSFADYIFS